MRDWKAYSARQILLYLKDSSNPESRREWLLYLFSFFALGRKDKQDYQVWQNDNHPIELFSEDVITQKLDYINLNPVKAGMVEKPADWKYSSAPFYAVTQEGPAFEYEPLLEIVPIWNWFYEEGPGGFI